MKVNDAALRVYTVGQTIQAPPPQATETASPNRLAQSRFADQLSSAEKKFITANFTTESTRTNDDDIKGRFVDVVA